MRHSFSTNDLLTQAFTDFFGEPSYRYDGSALTETEDGFILDIDLPGVSKESIDIDWEDNSLVITATKKEAPSGTSIWKGKYDTKVTRTYKVTNKLDREKVTASYDDGVLRLTIPLDVSGKTKIKVN